MLNLTEQDKVTAAVKAAEVGVSGEIVPYVVEQSDGYFDRAMLQLLFLIYIMDLVFKDLANSWSSPVFLNFFMIPLLIALALFHFVPPLRVKVTPSRIIQSTTLSRAREAFIEKEIFRTRQRTGILLFVSLLEHQVIILCDSGINAKVEQQKWDALAGGIAQNIKKLGLAEALCWGINESRNLLLANGFTANEKDNPNEISDTVHIGKNK